MEPELHRHRFLESDPERLAGPEDDLLALGGHRDAGAEDGANHRSLGRATSLVNRSESSGAGGICGVNATMWSLLAAG